MNSEPDTGEKLMPSAQITLEDAPDALDIKAVRDGLVSFNLLHVEEDRHQALTVLLRTEDRAVVGGLLGTTYWGWLHVEVLWVAEAFRSQGIGGRMLETAEREARARGCHHAHLDTMSFQSRPFYESHGYTVFGELKDVPEGHSRIFLSKSLR